LNFFISRDHHASKIYFEHGGDLLSRSSTRDLIFYDLFARFYALVLVNSEYVKQRILKMNRIDPQRVRTFYIGIDPHPYEKSRDRKDMRRSLGIKANCKVIGAVGRLVEQKGVDDFIKTANKIRNMRKDVMFVIVGEGNKREALEAMSVDLGVDIMFLGDRPDVPDLLGMFDIFLFTSKWEPFGIILLEAMAARIPILGFSVGGAREIVDKGGGILLEERDHQKLAELVIDVLRDRGYYKRLAAQGHSNLVNNFHIEKSIRRLEREYLMLAS
jgi:glycosyltransferase involved in cell wall biosynthesis